MSIFGGGGGHGQIDVNPQELRLFQKRLVDYANSLRQLDDQLEQALNQLSHTYRDGSYVTFRTHVESAVLKQHQEELRRVEALIKHINGIATPIEQAQAAAKRSPF